ncbi:MAG: permease-like cell division protein FtsX [Clostridia bacterium]|nr:permease-like cell division protein FtsX [Clostridia bacterium]
MKYSRFGYFIGEGFRNVFKNKKSTGASLMIMCATMIIFGVFLVLGENINHIVKEVESVQGMQVFINKDTTEEQIGELGDKIRDIKIDGVPAVNQVVRKTKDEALATMKERFKEKQDLLATFDGENNIFPESYVVTLTDLKYSPQVQDEISKMDNVKKITSRDQTVTTLLSIAKWVRIVTGVILILLIFISMFIIANTIKLTVHARRKEISIMKYVGATNNFIRWPFIVEGMIIGIFAGAISIILIGLLYNMLADALVNSDFMKRMNISLLPFADMFNYILVTYVGLGMGIGAFGSIISMRKYLKV